MELTCPADKQPGIPKTDEKPAEPILKAYDTVNGFQQAILCFKAMIRKKFLTSFRQPLLIFIQMIIPVAATVLGLLINKLHRRYSPDAKPLDLSDLVPYERSSILLGKLPNATTFSETVLKSLHKLVATSFKSKSEVMEFSDRGV